MAKLTVSPSLRISGLAGRLGGLEQVSAPPSSTLQTEGQPFPAQGALF